MNNNNNIRNLAKKKNSKEAGKRSFTMNENQPRKPFSTSKYVTGIADITSTGAAYIEVEGSDQDVYVAQRNTLNAMDGDKVKVRLSFNKKGKKPEGVIEEIVQRAKTEFVGTVQLSKDFAFLIPDSHKISFDLHIPLDKINGATNGIKAVGKMTRWAPGKKNPQGEIVRILGVAGKNDTEIHAILEEYGLPYTFPKEVEKAADHISTEITKEEISKRRDFRSITTFTIDPVDAKDFDDAISVQKLKNGLWEIGVHIADVAHYVKENTPLDKEAYTRATSVYLVDRVVPMLPENLSNGLCSLRPKEEKLCFSAVFEMDDNAQVRGRWFGRTVINSDRRFTYEEAQQVIETGKGDFSDDILLLNSLAKKLRAERFKKGSIAFDKLEVKFHLDENGNPTGVFFKKMKAANLLIEDFMLLANKCVAEFCSPPQPPTPSPRGKGATAPFVYRVHDKPDGDKLKAFAEIAARFGYKINLKNEITVAETINKTLKDCAGKPESSMIEILAIRTMAKAIYTSKNIGHYGLGFKHYTHFTSPIRRYPDVMVHRLLEKQLAASPPPLSPRGEGLGVRLEDQCKHSSQREKLAADAERASTKYKQVQYMNSRVGEEFEGMISGVTEWGIFVELTDNRCEGLIRIKDLRDDIYFIDEQNYCLIGRKSKRKLSLGDKVRIEVLSADMIKKQLNFALVG
ncbi:MAG: ribonuclease R [Bacteroidetes bacterium]|nr:MAG: ribonuclease R [Bacteroidota bacterium]